MLRIPYLQLKGEFFRVLEKLGFSEERAGVLARIFADNSRDGVYSHGLNRFPLFVQYVREGLVRPSSEPSVVERFGQLEVWDGNLGPGPLNASFCMSRAIELSEGMGLSCVALRNTNHWMRGGTYGWQAAEAGCISICFTNTIANMPPWGGTDPRLGNNPLVIGIPRTEGHLVLDMAMSQYSYGKLHQYEAQHRDLPYPGGFDRSGKLSTNPAEVISSQRVLPIGLWKGSGLSLMLDLLAAILSKGQSTRSVSSDGKEYGVSQVFICLEDKDPEFRARVVDEVLTYTKSSRGEDEGAIAYPGERMLRLRNENLEKGIPVEEQVWNVLLSL